MKRIIAILFLAVLAACTDKSTVRENVYHGMFDGMNQMNEMNEMQSPDAALPSATDQPRYEEYKKERDELLQDTKQ